MSNLLRRIFNPALEEASDGKANKELEYEFYARLVNPEELKQAQAVEEHEQWEIQVPRTDKNSLGGKLRIRKTIKGEGAAPEFVLTTKTKMADGSSIEVPVPTTEDNFLQFKYLSEGGMKKTRYVFPIEGSDKIWEVDVFHKPGGGHWEWVKIDLEVDSMDGQIPPFPIELADIITNQKGERTEEEERKIQSLFEYEFITKNEFLRD